MSIRGVVGPLRFNAEDAAVAAAVIEERTEAVDPKQTPVLPLPDFSRKLAKAVSRRRGKTLEIVLWTVTRNEAEAGYQFLMAFSHPDVPDCLNTDEMDAVHNIALRLVSALTARRGRQSLSQEDIEKRLGAWNDPETTAVEIPDQRRVRRLKQRMLKDDEFWRTAQRAPLPPGLLALLDSKQRKTTGN